MKQSKYKNYFLIIDKISSLKNPSKCLCMNILSEGQFFFCIQTRDELLHLLYCVLKRPKVCRLNYCPLK